MSLPLAAEASMSLEEARERLQQDGGIDDVYLAFSNVGAGDHPEGDEAVSAFLVEAARFALRAEDAHMAHAMAQIAGRLVPKSPKPALAMAEAALKLEQMGTAIDALDEALRHNPDDGELLFQRANVAELELDLLVAAELFERVQAGHPRRAEAQEGARRAREALEARAAALEEVAEAEASIQAQQEEARRRLAEERRRVATAEAAAAKSSSARRASPFDPRRGEYLIDELAQARRQAREEGKPLTFVYTDPETSCGLARGMLAEVRRNLGGRSVLVFADARDSEDRDKLPRLVRSAFQRPESGRFIPKTVVVDGAISRVLAHVPYSRAAVARTQALENAQTVIREYRRRPSGG